MYKFYFSLLVFFFVSCAREEKSCTDETMDGTDTMNMYDSVYANHLGADEYGMKAYVMAVLKAGPNRDQDSLTRVQLQRAHLDNITRLANEGLLVLAGPFLDESELKGIYVFNVKTIAEAEELTSSDPAIIAGSLVMELHPWYGSAALMEVNEIHKQIAKIPI